MNVRAARRRLSLGLLLLAGAVPGVLAADPLPATSPFLPPATAGAPAESTPIELRGIMAVDGSYLFSIYDPTRHTGTWAGLNESGHDFLIKAYDSANDTVTVSYQGRVLTLPLHTAKVTTAPSAGPVVIRGPGNRAGLPPPVINPTPADEQRRLESVAAEVRRRRALREEASRQAAERRR